MLRMKVDSGSLSLVTQNMRKALPQVQKAAHETLHVGAEVLLKEITKAVSFTDHSLAELRALDHPYALRGGVKLHGGQSVVHQRTGAMLRSLKLRSGKTITIEFDPGVAPHAKYVLSGTRWMRARNVMAGVTNDSAVMDRVKAAIQAEWRNK